jgi:N-acetylmuramic acid 6-phosphate etherase
MQLEDFLQKSSYFSLGHLPTEGFHPATTHLSVLTHSNPEEAIRLIGRVDLDAVRTLRDSMNSIQKLSAEIHATLESGNRVFLSGCGATGRLALTLESTFRAIHRGQPWENRVQGLMAGGDFALVKSVENFEDFPSYGERHLSDLGFREGDLLIAVTEGGETPYVIGTVHGALSCSSVRPWFIFCNPTELLTSTVERSREVIENPRVNALCLSVGPMALSGSTRLQAATVQMLAVGMALTRNFSLLDLLIEELSRLDLAAFLTPFVEWESEVYRSGGTVLYRTSTYPIAVLTDTTERSPTFSLAPFEKSTWSGESCSWCYLSIPEAESALESWERILNRKPIGLEWDEFGGKLGFQSILEFDFGKDAELARSQRIRPKHQENIRIEGRRGTAHLDLSTGTLESSLESPLLLDPIGSQILIKIILNTLSLVVMGRMDRYEGNVMTWVRSSNGKLIDRTLRYLDHLIARRGLPHPGRESLVGMVFETQARIGSDEAVILRVLERIKTEAQSRL